MRALPCRLYYLCPSRIAGNGHPNCHGWLLSTLHLLLKRFPYTLKVDREFVNDIQQLIKRRGNYQVRSSRAGAGVKVIAEGRNIRTVEVLRLVQWCKATCLADLSEAAQLCIEQSASLSPSPPCPKQTMAGVSQVDWEMAKFKQLWRRLHRWLNLRLKLEQGIYHIARMLIIISRNSS